MPTKKIEQQMPGDDDLQPRFGDWKSCTDLYPSQSMIRAISTVSGAIAYMQYLNKIFKNIKLIIIIYLETLSDHWVVITRLVRVDQAPLAVQAQSLDPLGWRVSGGVALARAIILK